MYFPVTAFRTPLRLRIQYATDTFFSIVPGDAGRLLYRGYPIEQIAKNGDMMDVWHLLLRGWLPTKTERDQFNQDARKHRMVHSNVIKFYSGFNHDAHPMAIMVRHCTV